LHVHFCSLVWCFAMRFASWSKDAECLHFSRISRRNVTFFCFFFYSIASSSSSSFYRMS
jgi:hypothetical protein